MRLSVGTLRRVVKRDLAIAFVPLALFPLEVAGWLWTLTTFALAIVAVRALLRSYLPDLPLANGVAGLTITMSTPAYHTFVLGQWGFALVAASAGAILAFRRGLDRRGVICALAFLAKPQLFVAAAVGLLTTVRAAINWLGRSNVPAETATNMATVRWPVIFRAYRR